MHIAPRRAIAAWLAFGAALALAPAPAAADKSEKVQQADALFAKGKAQLAKKQYAEACVTFEKVDELDPGIGAKLNVARCYEEWGKLVRAHKWYGDAQKMAASSGDKRAPKIKELIEKIEPDLPKLTLRVPEGADVEAAAITIDGERVDAGAIGGALPVEPGPHVIAYSAGGEKKTKTIAIERGGSREVTLDLPGGDGSRVSSGAKRRGKGGGKGKAPEAPAPPGRNRRIAAYALAGAGAVSMGVATYLALDARGDYRSALDMYCMGAKDMCNDEGLRLTHDARGQANLGTVFGLLGMAMVGGGVALYLTAPKADAAERSSQSSEALYLAPAISDRAGFVVLGGRY